MSKFEFNYDGSKLNYPATLLTVLQDICEKAGVGLGSTSFLNSNVQVATYDNTISAREYLSYIAESAGGFAFIGRDGKLYIRTIYQDEQQVSAELLGDFKWGDQCKITKVSYENGVESFKFGNDTGNNLWLNQENMYLVEEEQVEAIYDQLKDLIAYSFEGKTIIDPALDVGDKLIIDGKPVIYQGEADFQTRFIAEISSKIAIKQKQETTVKTTSQKVVNRRVQSRIDETEGKIDLLAEQQATDKTELEQAIGATQEQFQQFIDTTYEKQMSAMQAQIDGQIQSYFYDYEPTLSNAPANEWTTEDDKINHMGDLFYNSETGLGYRFSYIDNTWVWEELKDTDVGRALANAQMAQETANSKRRVFVVQPTPPYDVGDLWITDTKELKSCITAKTSGSYAETDWQDFVYQEQIADANELIDTINQNVANLTIENDNINATVAETITRLENDYMTTEQVEAENQTMKDDLDIIKQQQASMELTSSGLQVQIDEINNNGVSTVKNTTVTIDEKGVTVGKSDSEFSTTMSNTGTYMYSYDKQIAKYDKDGAEMYNLTVQNEAILGYLRFMKAEVNGEKRTHVHWIGG